VPPDGRPCPQCNGTHYDPASGVNFITARKWSTDDDVETDDG